MHALRLVLPALLAAFLATGAFAAPAASRVRTGTFVYDYRNVPVVSGLEGYEFVVLSARGASRPATVDSVHAWGGKVLALVQPTLAAWDRTPWENAEWDAALWDAARTNGGVLRDATGDSIWFFPGRRDDALLADFGAPGMADAVARAVVAIPGDGIVWDYGCGGVPVNGVAPDVAARWSAGWDTLVARVRAARPEWTLVCQCDRFTAHATPERCDGLLLERVGHSLNPPIQVWTNVELDPSSRFFLRQEDDSKSRRRLFAGLALLTGGVFAQCRDPNRVPPVSVKDPEHWELDLGRPIAAWRRLQGGVFERAFERGIVVVNVSETSYRHRGADGRTRTIPPRDALVAQTKDAQGPLVPWLTTSGR